MGGLLDREEYIEQSYFFRTLGERLAENRAAQDVLEAIHEEILSTTRLPLAVQFLATELKHTGMLGGGFARLGHYFTPFQTFVIEQSETENSRFTIQTALVVLEREAKFRADGPSPHGLFMFQFETLCRNRLGYDEGMTAMAGDPIFDSDWRTYIDQVRKRVGAVDFSDLVYVRSHQYVRDERQHDPSYEPPIPPLFGEKEGRIAKANHGRDPLYLFAALQRQLSYPEVPRPKLLEDPTSKIEQMRVKLRELEARLRLVESELKGQLDLQQFGKPELLGGPPAGSE